MWGGKSYGTKIEGNKSWGGEKGQRIHVTEQDGGGTAGEGV